MSFNDKQKDEIRRQYKLLLSEVMNKREDESAARVYTQRDDFQRDYSRILYSASFRRLQGKMQINGIKSDAFYRNRLTHSLEVAQIAVSIATLLSNECSTEEIPMYKNDIFLLQAAALAHDIGHPAFGHKGERVLDEIAKEYGLRFEGNAQNFKLLRRIDCKEPKVNGLNLTNRTLLAINKYLTQEDKNAKKFLYKEDFEYLDKVRKQAGLQGARTLDVQIIELADDIAYAVHDLEDGLQLRKFSIDEITHYLRNKHQEASKKFDTFINHAIEYANEQENDNVQKYSKLIRMSLTSQLTNTFVNDVTINEIDEETSKEHNTNKSNYELELKEYKDLLKVLKKAVFECSTRDTNIQEYERKGEIIIKSLFNFYTDLSKNINAMLLPPDYRPEELQKKGKGQDKEKVELQLVQNSIDYIAGMMDTFAISEYERLFSIDFDNIDLGQDIEIKKEGKRRNLKKIISQLWQRTIAKTC